MISELQDNALRTAAEHAVLQEEIRTKYQRNGTKDHGCDGSVKGSVPQ